MNAAFVSLVCFVTSYFVFIPKNLQHKNITTIYSYYFLVPGASFWAAGWIQGSYDCCWWGWFIVVNQPVLLWISLICYGSHPVFELKLVMWLLCWHKFDHWLIIKKHLSFGILIWLLLNGVGPNLGRYNNKTIMEFTFIPFIIMFVWSISFIFNPLLIIFTCVSFVLTTPKQLENQAVNIPISLTGIEIYNTLYHTESFQFK